MPKIYDLEKLKDFCKNRFIYYRTEYDEASYTYEEVLDSIEDILEQFRHYNIVSNVGIALHLECHSAYSIILLLSILNYKCYFVPLNYKNKDDDFEAVLNAHGAKYIISDVNNDIFKHGRLGCLRVSEQVVYLYENKSWTESFYDIERTVCYSITTSGSTGKPKVVQVPYSCVEPNIESLSSQLKLSNEDVIYLCAPITFDPFVVELFLTLNSGAALLITPTNLRSNPKKLMKMLWPPVVENPFKGKHKYRGTTILQTTPSFFRLFGDAAIREVILHESCSLRCLVLGGEDFPSRLEWKSWLPAFRLNKRIFNIYGITELSCWCIIHECNFYDEWVRAPLGSTLDIHTKLRIIDKDHKELFGVCDGQLEVGSAIRKCYIPAVDGEILSGKTHVCFRATGDIVHRDESGNLYYLGRVDNVIKRMGIRLNIENLEQKIQSFIKNEYTNVKCIWQKERHKLTCFIETSTKPSNIALMHIRRVLMQNLVEEERPDEIKFVLNFPLNSNGKIDRRCLMSIITENTTLAPTDIFRRFLKLTLGIDISNGINENCTSFTAAGGTSLHAIALANEIGATMKHCDQGQLLRMLLSPQQSLISINEFLLSCLISKTQYESWPNESSTILRNSYKKILKFLWSTSLKKCVDSAPTIVDNKWICIGSHSHILTTLDCRLGSPIAALELPDRIECKVEVVPNQSHPYLAIVGCYDHHLYAYNYVTGRIYWRLHVGGMVKAKPLSFKMRSFVATYGHEFNFVCVCLMTRKFIWRRKIGEKGIFASPVSINGCALIICTLDGSFCKICMSSGNYIWLKKFKSPIFSTPVLNSEEGIIILAEVEGNVHICNAENGDLLKTFVAGSPIFSDITSTSIKKICFGCYDKHIYCLEYRNLDDSGQQISPSLNLIWKSQLDSNIFASPVAISLQDDTFVLCCSTKGLLALLLIESGEVVAMRKLPGEVFSTPCSFGNQIFIGCRDNNIYSFCIEW